MQRISTLLCVLITLILTSTAPADEAVDSALRQLEKHGTYSLELEGRDEDGEFTATYLYSPELQLLRRKDKNGTSTYLYDREKRPDKVMVTRRGVAYLYRLDNPLLPKYIPGSLLEHYLQSAGDKLSLSMSPDGQLAGLEYGEFSNEGLGFSVSEVVFDPDLEDPQFSRMARYLRGR